MKKTTIENIGTVKLDNVSLTGGQLEIHIPLEEVGKEADAIIKQCLDWYKEGHPRDDFENDVLYDFRLVFSFGYANPEFTAEVIVWQDTDEMNDVIYPDIPVELSEEATKKVKRIIWDKLSETFFNL